MKKTILAEPILFGLCMSGAMMLFFTVNPWRFCGAVLVVVAGVALLIGPLMLKMLKEGIAKKVIIIWSVLFYFFMGSAAILFFASGPWRIAGGILMVVTFVTLSIMDLCIFAQIYRRIKVEEETIRRNIT